MFTDIKASVEKLGVSKDTILNLIKNKNIDYVVENGEYKVDTNSIGIIHKFDGNDKLGLFDGTNSKSARNVGTVQELMKLSGFSPSEISDYTNQYFTTNARKYGDAFANFLQSILGPK